MTTTKRLPTWFKRPASKLKATRSLADSLGGEVPNSICEEARCPNRSECFSKGVLTFMILGTVCTRNCTFCSVVHGKPMPPEVSEVDKILNAINILKLKFVVLTSPNRDDLKDGGSGHYAHIIRSIKTSYPTVRVEVLIPDFKGRYDDLKTVVQAKPDVINHNIETVPSLYRTVRKGSLYQRSLGLLKAIKEMSPKQLTKSGLMVGLGEDYPEMETTFKDIYDSKVDILTLGQYLKPDKKSLDVEKYYHPDEFNTLKNMADKIGFRFVFSGPYVRSSYLAEHVFEDVNLQEVLSG